MERIKSPKTINENSLIELHFMQNRHQLWESCVCVCGWLMCKCVSKCRYSQEKRNWTATREHNEDNNNGDDEEDQVETHRYQMVYMRQMWIANGFFTLMMTLVRWFKLTFVYLKVLPWCEPHQHTANTHTHNTRTIVMLYYIGRFRRNDIDIFCPSIFFSFYIFLFCFCCCHSFRLCIWVAFIVRTPFPWASIRINVDRLRMTSVWVQLTPFATVLNCLFNPMNCSSLFTFSFFDYNFLFLILVSLKRLEPRIYYIKLPIDCMIKSHTDMYFIAATECNDLRISLAAFIT